MQSVQVTRLQHWPNPRPWPHGLACLCYLSFTDSFTVAFAVSFTDSFRKVPAMHRSHQSGKSPGLGTPQAALKIPMQAPRAAAAHPRCLLLRCPILLRPAPGGGRPVHQLRLQGLPLPTGCGALRSLPAAALDGAGHGHPGGGPTAGWAQRGGGSGEVGGADFRQGPRAF